jgi:heat shock protein HslJ
MKNIPVLTLTVLIVLTLTACATGAMEPKLEGTNWELVKIDEQLPLADTSITLKLEEGQAGGNAGCNSYGAAYEIDGDTLKLEDLMSTMMYCQAEGVMDQETDYLFFLSQVRSYAIIDGALYLSQADGRQLKFIPQK